MKTSYRFPRSGIVVLLALVMPLLATNVVAQDASTKTLVITTQSDAAKQHFEQGVHDMNNVFFTRAVGHFEAAVKADPEFALAQFMHDAFVGGLNQDERLAKMDASLGQIAKTSTAELLFATGLRERTAGNRANAFALLSATADLAPDDATVASLRAGLESSSEARIAALKDVTERFPKSAATYNTLAYALWATGDKAGARTAVAKYMELEPNHPNSHDSYAELLQFSGLYGQAAKHYQKAIELDKTYFAGHMGLAETQVLSGDGTAARKTLEDARQFAGTDAARIGVTRSIANTYLYEANGAKALSTLADAAAALDKTSNRGLTAATHREMAMVEALYGNKANIGGHIARAIELTPDASGNHAAAALAYGLAGDAASASKATREFDKASDGSNFTKTLDGMVLLVEGKHAAAETALIASGLDNEWSMAFLARCEREMGNVADATSLEREIFANSEFTINNFNYTAGRLALGEAGAGHIRAGLAK